MNANAFEQNRQAIRKVCAIGKLIIREPHALSAKLNIAIEQYANQGVSISKANNVWRCERVRGVGLDLSTRGDVFH